MLWIGWTLAIIMFAIAFVGLIYPVIPSVVFILAGFLLYGAFVSFEELTWLFWVIQVLFVVLLFGADMVANLVGVKRFGGSKGGNVGKYDRIAYWSICYSGRWYFSWTFSWCNHCRINFHTIGIKQAFRSGVGSVSWFFDIGC